MIAVLMMSHVARSFMDDIGDKLKGLCIETDLPQGRVTAQLSLWQVVPQCGQRSLRDQFGRWPPSGRVICSVPQDRIVMSVMRT